MKLRGSWPRKDVAGTAVVATSEIGDAAGAGARVRYDGLGGSLAGRPRERSHAPASAVLVGVAGAAAVVVVAAHVGGAAPECADVAVAPEFAAAPEGDVASERERWRP